MAEREYDRIPLRSVRVPDDVWEHAKRCAEAEGTSVSAYIVERLRRWRPKV
jgi:hypothetical protein